MDEFKLIHQVSEKFYPDTKQFIDEVIYYIKRYFEDNGYYKNFSNELFLKDNLEEIKTGDNVNENDGGIVLRFDFRDFETPESLTSTFLNTFMKFVKSPDSYSEYFVIQLVHYVL